jgi:hypothetical protein
MKDDGCRLHADENESPEPDGAPATDEGEGPRSGTFVRNFIGDFVWSELGSGSLVDFERLTLFPSGQYVARVVATLVNPGVRSFGDHPCMLAEEGEWNTYQVSGRTRMRIRPTTGRARVYSASILDGALEISRRGQKTTLFRLLPHSGEVPVLSDEVAPRLVDDFQLRSA